VKHVLTLLGAAWLLIGAAFLVSIASAVLAP